MHLITRMSLKNRLIVGLLTLVIAVFGIVATTSLNQETMPSVDLPGTSVQATVPYQMDEVPVTMFAVSGGDPKTLGDRLETDLVPELRALDGVSNVEVTGQDEQRVSIAFRPEDVAEKNVVESSVPDELEAAGTVVPAGRSAQGDTSMAVEVGAEVDAVEQIENTPLRTADGTVLLGEVADVPTTTDHPLTT